MNRNSLSGAASPEARRPPRAEPPHPPDALGGRVAHWDFESGTFTSHLGSVRFSHRKAVFIEVLYRARNRGGIHSRKSLMETVYADDPDGGPEWACGVSVHLNQIRRRLEPLGWTITKSGRVSRASYQLIPLEA